MARVNPSSVQIYTRRQLIYKLSNTSCVSFVANFSIKANLEWIYRIERLKERHESGQHKYQKQPYQRIHKLRKREEKKKEVGTAAIVAAATVTTGVSRAAAPFKKHQQ